MGRVSHMDENTVVIAMKDIVKKFGDFTANDHINLTVHKGEVHAILGENGAGKSTLMNVLCGLYKPTSGQIQLNGKDVTFNSPKDAIDMGIGMVHQHFKLVDVFSAAENIILGIKDGKKYSLKAVNDKVFELSERYGFHIDPRKKIHEMSVSEKQTVEILKVLYRGANILILDEPTAVLTPQETERLFSILRRMRDDGKSILIITHKLHEVLSLSDRVAVLRRGEHIATVKTAETNESELTEMMVGKKISLNIDRPEPENATDRLYVNGLTVTNEDGRKILDDVSFEARAGEILGIAGIAGSGQKELLEAIAGLQKIESGAITYIDPETGIPEDLRNKTPIQIRNLGVRLSFVPEDRLGMGLVGNMDIVDNMMLRSYNKGHSMFLDRKDPKKLAEDIIESLEVVTPGTSTPVRRLSGGNVQKILVGREIASAPTVLMAAYPVRGLDINSSYTIYNLLTAQKQKGVAVVFVGEDLDVLLELCDRIMVVCAGRITGIVDGRDATKEGVGRLMTKTDNDEETGEEA